MADIKEVIDMMVADGRPESEIVALIDRYNKDQAEAKTQTKVETQPDFADELEPETVEVKEEPTPEDTTVKEDATVSTGEESSTVTPAVQPDQVVEQGGYEYKFGIGDDDKPIYYTKKKDDENWVVVDPELSEENFITNPSYVSIGQELGHFEGDVFDREAYFKQQEEDKKPMTEYEIREKVIDALPGKYKLAGYLDNAANIIKDLITKPEERAQTLEVAKNAIKNVKPRLFKTALQIQTGVADLFTQDIDYDPKELEYLKTLDPTAPYEDPMGDPTGFKTNADKIKYLEDYSETPIAKRRDKTEEFMKEKYKEIQAVEKYLIKDTGEGIVKGIKQGDASDLIGGIINANTSMVETVVPAMLTGGISLPFQVIAPMYSDYNEAKAKAIYGKDDPDAMDKLIDNGQTELAIPAALGLFATSLEYIGFKGITKYMFSNPGAKGFGAKLFLTSNREGLTEWGQGGIEKANIAFGEGKNYKQAGEALIDNMFSEAGVESYLNGFVGASGMSTAGSVINRALRSDNASIKDVNDKINNLADLNYKKNKTRNKDVKNALDIEIKEAEQDLKNYINEKRKLNKVLTAEEKTSLTNILNEKDGVKEKIQSLKTQLQNKEINNKEFGYAIRSLNNQDKKLSEQLSEIQSTAVARAAEKITETVRKQVGAIADEQGVEGTVTEATGQEILDMQGEKLARLTAERDSNQEVIDDPNQTAENKKIAEENVKDLNQQIEDIENADATFGYIDEKIDDKGDLTGDFEIVINKDKPMIGTAAHEFMHKVLFKTLKNNKDLQTKVGDAVTTFINEEKEGFNKPFVSRMSAYINPIKDKDGKVVRDKDGFVKFEKVSEFGEEVVTVMSESILDGSLKYNENFFTKLGDIIRQNLQRYGFKSIQFNSGRDVYNFIKDFNKSIEKGYTSKAITEMAVKGAKGKLVEGKKKARPTAKRKMSKVSPKAKSFLETKDEEGKLMFTNEMLVDIANNKRSKEEDKFGAIEALIEKNWPVISKALKFSPTGDITMESIKTAISEQMMGIFPKITLPNGQTINREGKRLLDTYNKENTVTTFLDNTLGPRQAEIFTRAKTIDAKSQGVSLDEAKNIAVSTELENETSNQKDTRKRVNVLKIPKVARVAKEIRQDTKIQEGDTHKQVTKNNEGHIGNKIFNIPENKVTKPKDNLTTSDDIVDVKTGEVITKEELDAGATGILSPSESKNIQDVFSDYETSEQFIKILPKTNVSEKDALVNEVGENIPVSRDVYGRAIGLQDRILEYFYKPLMKPNGKRARSQGKTSQVPLWTLKEEFINPKKDVVVQFQRDLGITEKKQINILPTKEKRSEIGQLLKGAARTLSQQVSLSAAQRNLEAMGAPKQQIADITAAQRRRAYSKAQEILDGKISFLRSTFQLEYNAKDKLLDIYDIGKTYNIKTPQGRKDFIKFIKTELFPLLPKEFWFKGSATAFTYSNANYGLSMNNPKEAKIYNAFREEIRALAKDKSIEFGPPINGANWKLTKGYNTIFGKKNNYLEKMKDKKAINEWNANVGLIHREMWKRFNNAINKDGKVNKEAAKAIMTYLGLTANDKQSWHRLGAQLAGYSKKLTDRKGKSKASNIEFEHAMPATAAYLYLMDSILSKSDFKTSYDLVVENYKLIVLDKAMDDKLRQAITKSGYSLQRRMPDNWSVIENSWWERYFNDIVNNQDGGIDPNSIIDLNGKTFSEKYNIKKPITKPNLNKTKKLDKAIMFSRPANNPTKGITVLDFDDTLATTKSLVKYTTPDGTTGTLNAEQYASTYEDLLGQGYTFDFSDFNKVVKGKVAPLFQKAIKLQGKFGPENMFVLTARPPAAAKAIFDFLKANGLNIPMKNITGLANSTAEAKALWMADKVGEGYNDFYFADDALQNVQAVDNMLEQFDVKRKVQQAKIKFSKDMNTDFNNILEEVTGIESKKRFAATKARKRGADKGKFRFFIPPSHEDFVGLLYNFIGKGRQGDGHRDFFEKALVRPLNRANREYDTARQSIANDYKALNKQFPDVKNKLTKKTPDGDFTFQDAIRVYLWNKHDHNIPGLSEIDQANLSELVMSDAELQAYAETLNIISKQDAYINPTDGWESGDIRVDLDDATGRVGRDQFFAEFNESSDIIFSEENLNKIEAGYGKGVREALEDMLYRIKTGRNRPSGQNRIVNAFMNYLNGSVGTVMFFNMRSALLQQMSLVNYINFADNNIFAAAKAFANQKQYWKDFAFIFNSDMLKQRRGGIQTDVNGAELAESLRNSKNPTRKLVSKLLELGFLPTQIGDNIAIATGGAPYYRNRINTYLKQGMTQKEAEAAAFTDFQNLTQSTQQSARPDMVSQQQASVIGKVILNFQNVTSQFNRLGKKAFQDIYNRRITKPNATQMQSDISNAARITYYFAVQNAIFYTLQTALFAMLFDDDEEDDNKLFLKKKERLINGSIDSVLRGSGVLGAVVATLKNTAIAFARQRDVRYNPDESAVLMEALNLSPVVGIKGRKITNAEKTLNYNKNIIEEMSTFDIDNPQWSAATNYVEMATNVPLNRLYNKTQNVRQALNNDHSTWERTLMFLGWSQYNLNVQNKKMDEIKETVKEKKKIESKERAKVKREEKKKIDLKEKEAEGIEKQKQQKKEGKQVTCLVCKLPVEKGKKYCTIHEKVDQRKDGKKRQCRKRKADGKRCGMQTSSKSGYCYYHD